MVNAAPDAGKNHEKTGVLMRIGDSKVARRAWSRRARVKRPEGTGDTAAPIHPRERDQLLGRSTLSTTWITPFDWNTFWIVTLEALPLASQIVSALPLASTVSSSPSTVFSLARPPSFLAASIRSFAERRPGTT